MTPQPPSTSSATTTSRKRSRSRTTSVCWICATAFTFVWSSTILWAHYYAATHTHPIPLPNNAITISGAGNDQQQQQQKPKVRLESPPQKQKETNPWYGWQPKIAAKMDCSWMRCLQDNHNCKTCRDEDLGNAPPAPAPADGTNWIPDVTVLHRMFLAGQDNAGNPWPPPLGEDLCQDFGKNDINNNLFKAVPITIQQQQSSTTGTTRIFCGVYTMEKAHGKTIRAMRETWASRCDGFLAFSTTSDPRIPAMEILHDGKEEYNNMWQKSRAIWKFIGDHYLEDYDYFFLGGDDLFVLVDNLRSYLSTLPDGPDADHFVGRRFKGNGPNNYFNSGGAGYVLSRGTLRKYITIGYNHQDCAPKRHTSMEDVMMAECLREAFQIGLTDTRDAEGRERFHPFAPGTHLTWQHPKPGTYDWYEDYNKEWGVKLGKDCCAPDSVSFHYIKKPTMVRHLHSLLYDC